MRGVAGVGELVKALLFLFSFGDDFLRPFFILFFIFFFALFFFFRLFFTALLSLLQTYSVLKHVSFQ